MVDILDDWKKEFNKHLDDDDIWGLFYKGDSIDMTKTLRETGYLWFAHLPGPEGCFRILGKWNKIKRNSIGGGKWHFDGLEGASDDDTDDGDGDGDNNGNNGMGDGGECSGSGDGGGDKKRVSIPLPGGDEPGRWHNISSVHVKRMKAWNSYDADC